MDFLVIIIWLAVIYIYFIPSLIGWKKKNKYAILALNIFGGWTIIGWVAALVWSLTHEAQQNK